MSVKFGACIIQISTAFQTLIKKMIYEYLNMGIKVDPRGQVLVPRGHQNFASLHGCFSAASGHILLTYPFQKCNICCSKVTKILIFDSFCLSAR